MGHLCMWLDVTYLYVKCCKMWNLGDEIPGVETGSVRLNGGDFWQLRCNSFQSWQHMHLFLFMLPSTKFTTNSSNLHHQEATSFIIADALFLGCCIFLGGWRVPWPTTKNTQTGWWLEIFFYFHPDPWGDDPIWLAHIFQQRLVFQFDLRIFFNRGWFNHQLATKNKRLHWLQNVEVAPPPREKHGVSWPSLVAPYEVHPPMRRLGVFFFLEKITSL